MSDAKETEEIEVQVDEPVAQTPDIVVEAEAKPVISAEDGVEELRRRLEVERKGREEAEYRAHQATSQAQQARNEVDSSNLQLVRTAIDTMKREGDILKANYKQAMAVGDYDSAAEYQEAMADARAKLLQLENGMSAMEAQSRQPADPVEQLASQLSAPSAAWVRAHPEYARTPRLTQKMIAAHNLVTADGIASDTPEYFASVEKVLGIGAPVEQESALSSASAPAQRRSAPAAAPVSRSGTATGTRPNVVRLSSEEREMASMMGMSPEDYARNKIALKREGKLH
jgi:phage I-like protein